MLLIDGETLVGGCQNRILTTSVVVPAGARRNVSGHLRRGRPMGWRGAAGRSLRSPCALGGAGPHLRHVVETGRAVPDQGGVWDAVASYAAADGVELATEAMEDVHAHAADCVRALVGATKPLAGQCGVAAAIGPRLVAVDLFDDPDTLADYWDALVAGYALDADDTPVKRPRRREVHCVLGDVAAGRAVTTEGRAHIATERAAATVLVLDDVVVHLAVSAA